MSTKVLLCIIVLSALSCSSKTDSHLQIEKDKYYPRWLKSENASPRQTSGIAYIKTDNSGSKHFLLADDIGKIHHMVLSDTGIASITPVYLSPLVVSYLHDFPKIDFEEILYDKFSNTVYISIEGNLPAPEKFTGIFKISFADNNILSDTVISISKIKIKPESLFLEHIAANIGFEGMAADEDNLYFGLEGFSESGIFADSTIILVVDKLNFEIRKQINTAGMGIHTICGLYSDKNKSLYGIDRNRKKIFRMVLGNALNVEELSFAEISSSIPYFPAFNYVASLESITMDEQNDMYLVDDPWTAFFIPSEDVLKQLDSTTVDNFKKFVPVLYKFKVKN